MAWDTDLLNDQKQAASHTGSHARLLAGPGTGKTLTLTRRIVYLINEQDVSPDEILVLSFTRAAIHELREKVKSELEPQGKRLPRISTLHSFALRQLLRNSEIISALPRPLRIADDWEERWIIQEDLKQSLGIEKIREVQEKFNLLSADWQTLVESFRDSRFLGAWREHREIYEYTLRAELVYQLKRALEREPDFKLESNFKYILVDEYQDLNCCDLAVIKTLGERSEVFCAGDDDQSIYGFRFAYPEGIRRFNEDYVPSTSLELEYCKRCDKKILDLGLFVANLDYERYPKPLRPMPDSDEGEVHLLCFGDQEQEANGVAKLCGHLIDIQHYQPGDILILIRIDSNNRFSSTLCAALKAQDLPVAVSADAGSPLDHDDGRILLSILRILVNPEDHLAWRTLLKLRRNNIGDETILGIYNLAHSEGITFTAALRRIEDSPEILPRLGNKLADELKTIRQLLAQFECHEELEEHEGSEGNEMMGKISQIAEVVIPDEGLRNEIATYLLKIAETSDTSTVPGLVVAISTSLEDKEQEVDKDKINIMTMHKAKGLTAKAVFIVAAEDEYIPLQLGEKEGDERRLFYVSLTRAEHYLYVSYCQRRTTLQQRFSGRERGKQRRTLTRFLVDAPIHPEDAQRYLRSLN